MSAEMTAVAHVADSRVRDDVHQICIRCGIALAEPFMMRWNGGATVYQIPSVPMDPPFREARGWSLTWDGESVDCEPDEGSA